jgi:hypothetical protein
VAVGGGYYFISLYSVILIVKVLKYGPRIFYQRDDTARYDSEVSCATATAAAATAAAATTTATTYDFLCRAL